MATSLHPPPVRAGALALLAAGACIAIGAAVPVAASPARLAAEDRVAVHALRAGGVAVLMRHSETTPGVGDPAGWKLADCATQRNLNAAGRAHARRVGEWFKSHLIAPTTVRNSPWCRTRDTARLAFGRTQDWKALANLFENRAPEKRNVELVRSYIAGLREGEVAVLVSHGSSIGAFVGESLAQGEAVIVRGRRTGEGDVEITVVGRIAVP